MREPPHVANRRRVGHAVGRHVEDVTVRNGREVVGFFTGHPAVPGSGAAGAVTNRAADAAPRFEDLAAMGVEHQRGRPAGRREVVRRAAERRAAPLFVISNEHGQVSTTLTTVLLSIVGEFGRVAAPPEMAPPGGKCRHAVVGARGPGAAGHRVAGPAEAEIPEAGGQHQQRQSGRFVSDRCQRPIRRVDSSPA